jgi:hypothetical protein
VIEIANNCGLLPRPAQSFAVFQKIRLRGTGFNLIGTIPSHNSSMRLFWIPLVIVALFAIDRAYMDGQNADQVLSLVRWVGVHVTDWTGDLLRPLRKMAGG